ncbi:MAG: type I CRISPR-associated protein Cas7 [Candidatus Aenigmatarchaeota archaeon]
MAKNNKDKNEEAKKFKEFVLFSEEMKEISEKYGFSHGKRVTLTAIYYSFPSNQNASGSTGTNVISQKIIPWGEEAEPRIYISPYAIKRRIRDYWIKKKLPCVMAENTVDAKSNSADARNDIKNAIKKYIDVDLFGFMYEEKINRPGPITTWGAVSLEPIHQFIDFNSCILNVKDESSGGGSLINRSISKEFYFASFYINPDLILYSNDEYVGDNKEERLNRLENFLEAVDYALQKDSGGARDRPACIFKLVEINDFGYGDSDKKIFKCINVANDKLKFTEIPTFKSNKTYYYADKLFFDETEEKLSKLGQKWKIKEIAEEIVYSKN